MNSSARLIEAGRGRSHCPHEERNIFNHIRAAVGTLKRGACWVSAGRELQMSTTKAWPPPAACDQTRRCILIVEDELLIRFMLSDGLRDEGYHVIEACNADEALTILETATPDLMISDVRMPGSLNGLELLRAVKETAPTLPVIITSGHVDPAEALGEGAAQVVSKPYSMETVFEAVRSVLGGAE